MTNNSPDTHLIELNTLLKTTGESQKDLVRLVRGLSAGIGSLLDIIKKTDDDGIFMTYTPRSWLRKLENIIARQDSLIEPLNKFVITQGEIIGLLHKIEGRLQVTAVDVQKWKGEIRGVAKSIERTEKDIAEGLKEQSGGIKILVQESVSTKPKMDEIHTFVLKWKYGLVPLFATLFFSGAILVLKLIELFSRAPKLPSP